MRYTWLALTCALGLAACGGDRDQGRGGIVRRGDASVGQDALPAADAAPGADASPFDDAATSFDASPRPDGSGTLDAAPGQDAAPADAGVPPRVVSIYAIQDVNRVDHPPADTPVIVQNVLVSAVVTSGTNAGSFFVQEPAGGPNSGVYAFKQTTVVLPPVAVGDRVNLTGLYQEYFDLSEVVLESVTVVSSDSPPAPQLLTAFDLAGPLAESFEGVLVRVDNVAVSSVNPDAPQDFGELEVAGVLRVDDLVYRHPVRPPLDFVFSSLSGVLHYAFNNYKLEPRGPEDLVPNP